MGTRGPAPKRSDRRLGHRSKADQEATDKAPTDPMVAIPEPDAEWHPVAKLWFNSLAPSGQSAYYTSSDWGLAYVTAEMLSKELHPKPVGIPVQILAAPITAAAMGAFLKACSMLLVSEADRRRVSLELQRPKLAEEVPDVSELASYRQRLQSS